MDMRCITSAKSSFCLNGLLNYALVVANTNFHFIKPIFIPRQGDLFLYGTEALICPIIRKGSWVGCLGGKEAGLGPFSFRAFCVLLFSDTTLEKWSTAIQKLLLFHVLS